MIRNDRRRRFCPACNQTVQPNRNQDIEGHWDSIGRDTCPGSYQPYRIAKVGRRVAA